MAVLVVVSVGATYAVTQGIIDHPNGPSGALMTGNVKITQLDDQTHFLGSHEKFNPIETIL